MQNLFFILCAVFVLMFIYNTYCFWRRISFLKKSLTSEKNGFLLRSGKRRCFVLIPVYLEQNKIIDTIAYFRKISVGLPVEIVVVTTNKEVLFPTTRDVVLRYLNSIEGAHTRCVHYPEKGGYMAHQLNYAFEQLLKDGSATLNDFFVVYNADSHPHPQTLNWFFSIESVPDVVQQVAILYKNFNEMPLSLDGYVSRSFATLQTRWSLTHELPRMISNASGGLFSRFKNANCIGHGLFIKGTILKENNLFSEDTMTEDLFLGFLLRANGIVITSHPFMELAESPVGLLSNIKQRIVWSWGSIMYPHYFLFFVSKMKRISFFKIIRAFTLMLQGVFAWLRWIFSGVCTIFVALYPFFASDNHNYIVVYSAAILFLYGFVQYFVTLVYFPFLNLVSSGIEKKRLPIIQMITISMFSYVAIILHSIAGIIGSLQYLYYLITGVMPRKYKTGENVI